MTLDPYLNMGCGRDAAWAICAHRNRCYIFGSESRRMNPVLLILPGCCHANHYVIDQFIHHMMSGGCSNCNYGTQQVQMRYHRLDNAYASQRYRTSSNASAGKLKTVKRGPANLDNTFPLNIMPFHLNSFHGMCSVMTELEPSIRLYLNSHKYCLIAGDWHLYTNLRKWIVKNAEKEYVNGIVPIPGLFHIGLNAQDVIIKKYFPLLSSIWKRVYPKSRTEFSITTMKMMPTMRKNFLGSLMNAWNIVKSRILLSMRSRAEIGEMLPIQWVSLHAMFVEFLPELH